MEVTPFGAKSPTSTVVGVMADADGYLVGKKKWINDAVQIYSDDTTPTSGTKTCTEVDLADFGAVSLRISNSTDKEITLGLYIDHKTNTYQMRDGNGALIRYTVAANTSSVMITPDDFPQLQWLKKLRLYFILKESATEGTVEIWAVKKG